jgi:hypothetical protein
MAREIQTPFPPLDVPSSLVPLRYPIQLSPPYDSATAVQFAAMQDGYDAINGGAWYNNWGDLKSAVSNELLNPQSDLRSGRFLNKVQAYAPLVALAGPRGEAAVAGLQSFRDVTGLGMGGIGGSYYGGANGRKRERPLDYDPVAPAPRRLRVPMAYPAVPGAMGQQMGVSRVSKTANSTHLP